MESWYGLKIIIWNYLNDIMKEVKFIVKNILNFPGTSGQIS